MSGAFPGLALFIHYKLSPKKHRQKWLNQLIQGSGNQVNDALAFIKEREEFEQEA